MANVDEIYKSMLDNISDDYEKSTGFLTADLIKAYAIELAKVYSAVEQLQTELDIENLKSDDLTRFVSQHKGIVRKKATHAKATLAVVGNGTINIGDLFATANNIEFKSLEKKMINGTDNIQIEAVLGGIIGNVGANTITKMPITITGITSVNNLQPSYDGFDEETDATLRDRYYLALQKPPTSGNKYHYLSWAKSVDGVGDAKVIPLWNGDNTVKVIIIDADAQPASQSLVDAVQNYIDPNISGTGEGQAPIGAYCTVTSAIALPINIEVDVTEVSGYSLETVKANIKANVTAYLKEIAFKQDYASYAKIGSIIISTERVKDYTTLIINGGTTSIDVPNESVAVMGSLTVI